MRRFLLMLGMALCVIGVQAQAPAFPGAEGHGRYVTGGRGGKIVHVTNLNDSGTGSFREAVSGSEAKIVVFDVGGVIPLESELKIGSNTTVAGQTAPSPGITLRYYTVRPGENNIIRFIRVRRGEEKDVDDGADAIWQRRLTGIILDHCSFSWSIDEVASFYDNNNFTMQWCTIAESLTNPGHSKGAHGYGGIWGGKLASFHHNLLAHVTNRVPRFNGARYVWTGYTDNYDYDTYQWENTVQAENVDFRNCVMYNWGNSNGCYGGPGGGQVNIVNNYYKGGPATPDSKAKRITEISILDDSTVVVDGMTSRYYISGNTTETNSGSVTTNRDWDGVLYDDTSYKLDGEYYTADPNELYDATHTTINGVSCVKIKMDSPAPTGTVTTHTAANAFTNVLSYAGASLYRDNVDERYMTEAANGTATYTGTVTGTAGLIDYVSDVEGYTEENFGTGSREEGYDTDEDGMPDEWETAMGLDPNDASDANLYTLDTEKGWYTNIEVYLSTVVESIMKDGNSNASDSVDEYYPCESDSDSDTDTDTDTGSSLPTDVTVTWDFQNLNPSTLSEVAIEGTTGEVASTEEGVNLYVDASTGKFTYNSAGYVQVNASTTIQVPVGSTNDVITVVSYPGQYNYTIGGQAATANETTYSPTSSEVAQGYVEIVATSTSYLYSISVYLASNLVEKALYSTDFTEWGDYATSAKETVTSATWTTNYSKENLTFSIYNTQISASNFNESKFPDWEGGMLMAAKSDTPYILTSALNSITRVHFMHGATGSNRGWKLEVKGDEDDDWVVVSETVASPAAGCDVTVDVNRTNCKLRFTNLNSSQNAYLMELDIYGLVDMSATPSLGTFSYNGVTYEAAEIFEDASTDTMTATIELDNNVELPSESNPITDLSFDNGSLYSDVTYVATTDTVVVTIVVTANGEEMTYIATFVHKPYYTLTYYNTDGTVLESTQQVEKDAAITTLRDSDGVTVEDGKAFRGWFVSADGGQKYTVEDVVTSDLDLYAVATDIEVESTTARYSYTLTDKYFYDEDHEAFNPDGAAFHDTTHGWSMNTSDKIDLLVGGHAYIIVTLCSYSSSSAVLTLTNEAGETVTASGYSSTDGTATAIEYTGSAGTLTLTTSAQVYLHKLIIANVEDSPVEENEQGYYVVNAGDADNLLTTLDVVNAKASSSKRTYVFLPNGTYDLGDAVLTQIYGDNISIIGQDMDSTIIVNKAPEEGISVSATFLIKGSNTYFQDLTLQNAYDYYNAGNAGRAVVIQDKGDRTICKNVKMLSYQDTYYSNNNGQYYFENSDIHGTVDFICGSGDVYFNECTLTIEPRKTDGTGECTITAPSTSTSAGNNFGYVFNYCTIDNKAASFNFGRAWNNTPRCAYLNTTIQNDKLVSNRWTLAGMNVVADKFVEYNTMDESGNVTSPSSKKLTFTYGTTSSTYETILTANEAEEYALENVFTDWTPAEYTVQKVMGTVSIDDTQLNLSWDAVDGAIAYAIFKDGVYVDMTTTNSYVITEGETGDYTVRAANEYGGFGDSSNTTTGINGVVATEGNVVDTIYYNVQGIRVNPSSKGVLIKIETLEDGTKNVTKVVR